LGKKSRMGDGRRGRTCLEMTRLERRAPALAATADIVTVADIAADIVPRVSC